ncbi:unnamed protein product [Caenorhabditis angaria]|uniref:Uncharacterized protein n=1 Tax=Caenorhabditis angaria TaxID=860376 RepID=A0A9P1IKR0_9PELO|nr:unnamed protein product [Caenorhabditis angaria]
MAERCQKMENMMEDLIQHFGESLKIDEPYKLLQRDGNLKLTRADTTALMEKMHEKAAGKFREKMRKLVAEQELEKRFEELKQLETESADRVGFACSNPKEDVNLHVLTTAMKFNNHAKEEVDLLKIDVENAKETVKVDKRSF